MLLILPPSESKQAGGEAGTALDLGRLRFPELTAARALVIDATLALAQDIDAMVAALKVGPGLRHEAERNRTITTSPVMPAIDRFTGVLFDALDAPSLDEAERAFAQQSVLVHSALFGLVGALDPIPAYRLSHDSRLPGLSLKKTWAAPVTAALQQAEGLVLDLRSEAYAALGPARTPGHSFFVRVVADDGSGRRRALNHFNKKGKGEFTRAFLEQQPQPATVAELCDWSTSAGFPLSPGADGELELCVRHDTGLR